MTSPPMALRYPALPLWSQQFGAVLAFASLCWLLVRQLLGGQVLLLALCCALAAAVLLITRTRQAALLWLLLVATLLPARILPLSVAGVRTDLGELLGLGLVVGVVARIALGERGRLPRATGPLVALVISAAFGALVAYEAGAPRSSWLAMLKTFLLYLVPLAFCWLFVDEDRRDQLERWIHGVCTYGGLFVLGFTALGFRVPSSDPPEVVTLGVVTDASRLRPALLTLTVLATLLLTARVLDRGASRSDVGRLAVYGTVLAASFTRSTWLPLMLALLLLAVLRPGKRTPLRGLRTVLLLLVLSAIAFGTASSGHLGSTAEAITLRIRSIGSSQVLEENSYLDRKIETTVARQKLAANPFTGIGLAQPYGAVRKVYDPVTKVRTVSDRRFIHNSVLGVWLWCGLPGLLALAWLSMVVIRTSVNAVRLLDPGRAGQALAAGLAVLALGLESTFQTSITNRSVIATLACALVFLDVPALVHRRRV